MLQPIKFFNEANIEKSKFPMMEPQKNSNKKKTEKESSTLKKDDNNDFKLNLSSMIDGGSSISMIENDVPASSNTKKKSANKKRKTREIEVNMNERSTENLSDRTLNDFESNTPYSEKYQETNMLLKSAIGQLEVGLQELQQDANVIRASKTMRKKYDYLSEIHGTIGNYIGNKISAIRELNNTINRCNEFELKRYKELKLNQNEQDDDKAIMEAYQAFVNTPVGSYGFSPLGPSSRDLTLNSPNLHGIEVNTGSNQNGYETYLQNMTPQQHMMALENDPNIKQVIVYDQRTGARYFEVMNMQTMEAVPNTDKMDIMLIDEFDLDLKNKVARSINMNITMPLIVIGDATLNEY